MPPDALIDDFANQVRDRAGAAVPQELRSAFRSELRRIAEAYPDDPAAWSSWANGIDVPGSVYEALLSGEDRRDAGQFQTPNWAADLMAAWCLQEPCDLLLDPGVGAGRLLFRAADRPEAGPDRMLGIDIDPVSIEMARVNLVVRGIRHFDLRADNFLLADIAEQPAAVICNPPYSRHHSIPSDDKTRIHAAIEDRTGTRVSRLAGLHSLFLLRALEIVQKGGRLAFITPAEWLDVNYGRAVKEFALERSHVDAIVLWQNDHRVFDGALTTASITLCKADPTPGPTRIIQLPRNRKPSVEKVIAAVNGEETRLRVREVELGVDTKWGQPIRRRPPTRGRELRELARVRRGIATGRNSFFVVSEATRRDRGLKRDDLLPCITTPRLIAAEEFSAADLEELDVNVPRWVINCRLPKAETRENSLGRYLRWGEAELNVHDGYLASRRKPWYGLEERSRSPILFTYMNRQRPRFIRNRAGAVPLNTFLIIEPQDEVDADRLWKTLRGDRFMGQLEHAKRTYGGGLWKVEPRELSELRILL